MNLVPVTQRHAGRLLTSRRRSCVSLVSGPSATGQNKDTRNQQIDQRRGQDDTLAATWDEALCGPKKDAVLRHYLTAEKAHLAQNDADTT